MGALEQARKALTSGFKGSTLFYPATLARTVLAPGTEDWNPGAATTQTYPCMAVDVEFGNYLTASGAVSADESRIMILAATLSTEPRPLDKITVRGKTYTISQKGGGIAAIKRDPALAAWDCRATR